MTSSPSVQLYTVRDAVSADLQGAVARVADTLAPHAEVDTLRLDDAEAGRAAAYLITNAESADFHLRRLQARAADFDPDTLYDWPKYREAFVAMARQWAKAPVPAHRTAG